MPDLVIEKWAVLGTDAVAMFLYLRNKTNRQRGHPLQGCAWPKFETMTKETGMSNRRIARALSVLEDKNLLERKKRYGRSVVYTLKRPPDMAVSSIVTEEIMEDDDSISTVESKYSHSENNSIRTEEINLDLKEKDKAYKEREVVPSLSQDLWLQALTAIRDAHYLRTSWTRGGPWNDYWLPTEYGGCQDGKFIVICQDEDQRAWLIDRGKKIAERALVGVLGEQMEVEFVCG
jgi:DNA-binding transcriptional regulator GbsR (MarR family)